MKIELVRADLTSLKIDAIVNPRPWGSLPGGTATVTSGGNVLCKFIIHVPIPHNGGGDEDRKLRGAAWAALQRAEELAISSVAFPTLSGRAHTMIRAALDFGAHARSLQRVVFCAFSEAIHAEFTRVLEELQG